MRTIKRYIIYFCLMLIPAYGAANDEGIVRLSLLEGDVQVLIRDTTDWTPATINLPLNEQDRLWIPGNGRAELQIRGGVYLRARGNSAVDILTVNPDSAQFYLDRGHIYIINRRGGISIVQVDMPGASLRSYDDSIMMVDVTEDGVNEISVLKGMAYAESRAGTTTVTSGNTLTLRGENSAQLSPIRSPDEWEQWNMDRDARVSAWAESSRYLPGELHEYASDFDRYGSWNYVAEYGYVWSPTVIAAGWAPYSYGNWVWIRGNYVWIDYDPWGWAPSHYGRWVFAGSRGWCWVPPAAGAVYWGPGYVGWVVTSAYVSWVPLAPGEIYYGYGYYGPGSVNITTVNINTVVVNRTYRNARVRNSIVTVHRDTFGTGRRVPVRIRENPFEKKIDRRQDIRIVPPRSRPEKQIVIAPPAEVRERTRQHRERPDIHAERGQVTVRPPVARQERERTQKREIAPLPRVTPPAVPRQLPPERVIRTRPEQMKKERPLIREREASVFKPQARPPQDLPVTRSHEPGVIRRPAGPPQQRPGNHGVPQQSQQMQQLQQRHQQQPEQQQQRRRWQPRQQQNLQQRHQQQAKQMQQPQQLQQHQQQAHGRQRR